MRKILQFIAALCVLTIAVSEVRAAESGTSATVLSSKIYNEYVDQAVENIVQTTIGKSILKNILACDAELIELHLGVTSKKAVNLSTECESYETSENEIVLASHRGALKKISFVENQKRKYVFILNLVGETWDYDSWTAAHLNETTINISNITDDSDMIDISKLTQVIAHEMAIYFDAKQWVGSSKWKDMSELSGLFRPYSPEMQSLYDSINNPLISHALSYIRAFKVEKEIMSELVELGLVEQSYLEVYSEANLPYLAEDCSSECLIPYLRNSVMAYSNIALPLVVLSPMYRDRWKRIENNDYFIMNPESKQVTEDVLINIPQKYHSFYSFLDPYLDYSNGTPIFGLDEIEEDETAVWSVFRMVLIPMDLLALENYSNTVSGSLEFLATPLLSGHNSQLTSGPRPGVGSGGGRGGRGR